MDAKPMSGASRLAALSTEVAASSPTWGALSAGLEYLVARREQRAGDSSIR